MSQRAVIYLRLSLDRTGEKESIAIQEADCRALCARQGWDVVAVEVDRDVSGYKRVATPGLDRALDMIRDREANVLVAWKVDRLTRRGIVRMGEILGLLDEVGARIAFVMDNIDTSTAIGEGILGFIASQAKQESQNTAMRTRAYHEARAKRGEFHPGGRRCFGYTLDGREIVPEEAVLLRDIRDRILRGESINSIVRDMNRRGLRTTAGNAWTRATLTRLLRVPRLRGYRPYKGELYKGHWEPIFTEDEQLALIAAIDDRYKFPVLGNSYLLRGLVKCGRCGETMRGNAKGKKYRRYACVATPGSKNCGLVSISMEPLEDEVASRALAILAHFDPAPATDDTAQLEALLDADRDALGDLARARYFERSIDARTFDATKQLLEERIQDTEGRLAQARQPVHVPRTPAELADWWNGADYAARRALIERMAAEVRINPATKPGPVFDPERVHVIWR